MQVSLRKARARWGAASPLEIDGVREEGGVGCDGAAESCEPLQKIARAHLGLRKRGDSQEVLALDVFD